MHNKNAECPKCQAGLVRKDNHLVCPNAKCDGVIATVPTQKPKTRDEVIEILNDIKIFDRRFMLSGKGDGWMLQVVYDEEDIETHKMEEQKSRKWYVSPFSTESEIVETAFTAVKRSYRHVVAEHFTYKGRRVYSPHFSVQARIELCDREAYDKRIPKQLDPKWKM